MYPALPYPGYKWSMNQHMGVATERNIYQIAWAAEAFRQTNDPVAYINNYLIVHKIFTKNIRKDSGQSDIWRDYQQVPNELGLLISTKKQKLIKLTPLGLAFIETAISYDELITLQSLRYQYPNGYKSVISTNLRQQLAGTKFSGIETLTELQALTGVKIRPAVLVWQILRDLAARRQRADLSLQEIQEFLLPCIKHSDTPKVTAAILNARKKTTVQNKKFTRIRSMQEWLRFLSATPLFVVKNKSAISITDFGNSIALDIDAICQRLINDSTFWMPEADTTKNAESWYSEFGTIDLSINLVPRENDSTAEIVPALDDDDRGTGNAELQSVNLRPFNRNNLVNETEDDPSSGLINASYEASLTKDQHILHDRMVLLIAEICQKNGGTVFDDPQSLDLLVNFKNYEFIVEVKSISPRNFVQRLRLALGQLLHYDYLRSLESQTPRRKVIALAARVSDNFWAIPFLNSHLDVDLLSLGKQGIEVRTNFDLSRRLFTSAVQPSSNLISQPFLNF